MKRVLVCIGLVLFCVASTGLAAQQPTTKVPDLAFDKLVQSLIGVSVTVVTPRGEGSGVVKTRKVDGVSTNFIWTAAHVVAGLRHERSIVDGKSGSSKTVVEFDDAKIVKELVKAGRITGESAMFAEVIRYSADEDLALLRLREDDFFKTDAEFYLEEKNGKPVLPSIGTRLIHIGSLLGQFGSNSYTSGDLSYQGRLLNKVVFDQTTVPAYPGSSGGGVYTASDGRCIGLILRGAGETFNLIAPTRRIHDWAKKAGVEWAMTAKAAMPTAADLARMPIEDNGISFVYSVQPGKADKESFIGEGQQYYLGNRAAELALPTYFNLSPKN
jgi:hypothetical protein